MPSDTYSFLDVAILDQVRARFAAGEALVILSTDLEQVIWANGSGAVLLGYDDIEAALGASARLGAAAQRQISGTRGFPAIGHDRPLLARLAIGAASRAVAILASEIALPDGEPAILLASPSGTETQTESSIIGGFGEAGHFVALIDAQGGIEAATPGFEMLGISAESLSGLLTRAQESRIVKRMVGGANGPLPAGLARLTDEPAVYLLVVIDESRVGAADDAKNVARMPVAGKEEEPPQAADGIETGEALVGDAAGDERASAIEPEPEAEAEPAQTAHDTWYFSSEEFVAASEEAEGFSDEGAASQPEPDDALSLVADGIRADADEREPAQEISAEHVQPESIATEIEPVETDSAAAQTEAAPASAAIARPSVDRQAAPIRFVWRTDAQGKFSQISPEFVAAVGVDMADIVGRRFEELAAALGFDANGEIAGLLDRRDTWSGRSVPWPVAGAGVSIPVDLAALPVYGRDRDFQGFRGFGVARGGDAIQHQPRAVPEPDNATHENAPTPDLSQDEVEVDAAHPADPFRGETPALHIAPMPDRRSSDKIIRLAEHRQPANDKGLSTGERMAFQQIAERLKRESAVSAEKPANDTSADTVDADAAPADASEETEVGPSTVPTIAESSEAAGGTVEAAGDAAKPAPADVAENATSAKDSTEPAVEPSADAEPTAGAGKRSRPGMSLLDFAQWDREGGTEDDAGETPDVEPTMDEETEASTGASKASDEAIASEPHGSPGEADSQDTIANDNAGADAEPALPQDDGAESPVGADEAARPSVGHGADTAILEKLPVPVLVHSGDELHYANDEFLALTGYGSIEQLSAAGGIGALFAEAYEDDNHPGRRDRQLRLITAKAEEFPVDAFLQSVPWHGGKALLLVLRRAEEGRTDESGQSPLIAELEARVAEMRTIIDTATDGVVLMTKDGTIRSISRPAEALFSFDSDEVAGKAFESLFAIESQRAARDYLNGLSDNGVASVLNDGREVIGRESRGRFIPLFMTIGKLPNDSGYCAVVRDITQWKRAEEDLTQARTVAERSSSQKTDFLARVSHEIRTPLNAIIGFSELMVDERFGPVTNDRYRDYLRDINRSGNHVLDLVNDLLDISKIEAGQQEMDYEAVSLNDALAETVAMMQPQANRERVIIRSSFASKLPDVVADLRSVRQIALNILSNAVRYTQAGGQVIVSTAYETAGDIVMRVRDTGIGMTPAEIEQAMKPFKQINSLKRARGDGTGLGLPLTKAMVEANRAKFVIHSTPGEGTLVEVTFPSTRVLAD